MNAEASDTRARTLMSIADEADGLTEPYKHCEPIFDYDVHRNKRMRRVWDTQQPSLLEQLGEAITPGEGFEEEGAHAKVMPRSTPAARLDAVARLIGIEAGAAGWCVRLHLDLRGNTASNIRALVGASAACDSDTQLALLGDLRRWKIWAETSTGWRTPPWQPIAPCPCCDKLSKLRIRLERSVGYCTACGEAWDEASIGILAEHVRLYRERSKAEAVAARARARADRAKREGEAKP